VLTNTKGGNKLRECDEQKVQVIEELELFVQDEREERHDVVLLIPHNVGRELGLVLAGIEWNRSRLGGRLRGEAEEGEGGAF
jgi:hypothetical protein